MQPIERVAPAAAPEPAPEQKKEETPLILCSFCEHPAVASNSILSTCMVHPEALTLHAGRMEIGLVDCPETRAETVRFVVRDQAQKAEEIARGAGFRTGLDRTGQAKRTSITDRREPTEAIPLVGTTPHYEWP